MVDFTHFGFKNFNKNMKKKFLLLAFYKLTERGYFYKKKSAKWTERKILYIYIFIYLYIYIYI